MGPIMRYVKSVSWVLTTVTLLFAAASWAEDDVIDQINYDQVPFREIVKDMRTRGAMKVSVQAGDSEALNRPVTLHFTAMPADEVLRYAALSAGLGFEIDDRGLVTIYGQPRLTTAFFRVEVVDREVSATQLQTFFLAGGVSFPPGSRIEYNRRNSTLSSVNTPDNQRRIGLIIGERTPRGLPRLRLNPELAVINNLEIARKLDSLKFGPEKKETASLGELLQAAHKHSVATDPEHVGINFFVMPEVKADEITLTVGLSPMTMREFLQTICSAAKLSWRYDDFAVVLFVAPSSAASVAAPVAVKAEKAAEKSGKKFKFKGDDPFEK